MGERARVEARRESGAEPNRPGPSLSLAGREGVREDCTGLDRTRAEARARGSEARGPGKQPAEGIAEYRGTPPFFQRIACLECHVSRILPSHTDFRTRPESWLRIFRYIRVPLEGWQSVVNWWGSRGMIDAVTSVIIAIISLYICLCFRFCL